MNHTEMVKRDHMEVMGKDHTEVERETPTRERKFFHMYVFLIYLKM